MSVLSFLDPNIDKSILKDAGERKVAETGKHWVVTFMPWVRVVIGVLMIFGAGTFVVKMQHWHVLPRRIVFWALLILALYITGQALWRIVEERRDRFVITNQRIFRVWGMIRTTEVSVPLLRILDITVDKPLLGRGLNYGNFVFKSAAEVKGLSLIDHVPDIDHLRDVLRMVMGGKVPPEVAAEVKPPKKPARVRPALTAGINRFDAAAISAIMWSHTQVTAAVAKHRKGGYR